MRRNKRCPLLRRVPKSDHCMVHKKEMIKGRYLRTPSDAWSVPVAEGVQRMGLETMQGTRKPLYEGIIQ